MWVQSLGWEDPLEKEMTTHARILAWGIPWTEETGGLQSKESQKSQTWLRDQTKTTVNKLNIYFQTFSLPPSLPKAGKAFSAFLSVETVLAITLRAKSAVLHAFQDGFWFPGEMKRDVSQRLLASWQILLSIHTLFLTPHTERWYIEQEQPSCNHEGKAKKITEQTWHCWAVQPMLARYLPPNFSSGKKNKSSLV